MTAEAIRKFTFDTEFDETGAILRDASGGKRAFNADELEAARREAFAEGETSAVARAQATIADALSVMADRTQKIASRIDEESARLKRDAVALSLAAAKAAAGSALTCYPDEAIAAFFEETSELLRAAPRVTLRLAPEAAEAARPRIAETAERAGLSAQIEIIADPDAAPGDCRIEWPEGEAERSAERALQRIEEAARRWLGAENAAVDGQLELFAA